MNGAAWNLATRNLTTKLRRRFAGPPASALAPLEAGERVVAWGVDTAGEAVLATVRGLWLPDDDDGRARLPWHHINKASWASPALTIIPVTELSPDVVVDAPARTLRLAEPRDLPAEVRVRMTRSVGYSVHHQVGAAGGVRVIGRRVAGQDGLRFVLRYDDPLLADDPAASRLAGELLARARAATAGALAIGS